MASLILTDQELVILDEAMSYAYIGDLLELDDLGFNADDRATFHVVMDKIDKLRGRE